LASRCCGCPCQRAVAVLSQRAHLARRRHAGLDQDRGFEMEADPAMSGQHWLQHWITSAMDPIAQAIAAYQFLAQYGQVAPNDAFPQEADAQVFEHDGLQSMCMCPYGAAGSFGASQCCAACGGMRSLTEDPHWPATGDRSSSWDPWPAGVLLDWQQQQQQFQQQQQSMLLAAAAVQALSAHPVVAADTGTGGSDWSSPSPSKPKVEGQQRLQRQRQRHHVDARPAQSQQLESRLEDVQAPKRPVSPSMPAPESATPQSRSPALSAAPAALAPAEKPLGIDVQGLSDNSHRQAYGSCGKAADGANVLAAFTESHTPSAQAHVACDHLGAARTGGAPAAVEHAAQTAAAPLAQGVGGEGESLEDLIRNDVKEFLKPCREGEGIKDEYCSRVKNEVDEFLKPCRGSDGETDDRGQLEAPRKEGSPQDVALAVAHSPAPAEGPEAAPEVPPHPRAEPAAPMPLPKSPSQNFVADGHRLSLQAGCAVSPGKPHRRLPGLHTRDAHADGGDPGRLDDPWARGRCFAKSLLDVPPPYKVSESVELRHCCTLASVLAEFRRARIRPTEGALTEALKKRPEVEEGVLQGMLRICAKFPTLFSIWLGNDLQLCIFLASDAVRDCLAVSELDDGKSKSPFSPKLLEAVVEQLGYRLQVCLGERVHSGSFPTGSPSPRELVPPLPQPSPPRPATRSATGRHASSTEASKPAFVQRHVEDKQEVLRRLEGLTTVMVKNLPLDASQQRFCQELDKEFRGKYDFAYAPSRFDSHESAGYAFVNFDTSESVVDFVKEWHGSQRLGSAQGIKLVPADVQGRSEISKKWKQHRLSRIKNPEKRPVLILDGLAANS